ncbi:MAG: hypothetical protein JW702_04720 [Clostridiales bacterium]|nr:hypothetical protein [Clostridiales bacterium]
MTSSISFFAGPMDDYELCQFSFSIGLRLQDLSYNPDSTDWKKDPSKGASCYLTFIDETEILFYNSPKPGSSLKLVSSNNPLLNFRRSYYEKPYLIAGEIQWEDYPDEQAKQTKPYYSKLVRWIKKNWSRREEDGYYVGPDAQRLIDEGAECYYFHPKTKLQFIEKKKT